MRISTDTYPYNYLTEICNVGAVARAVAGAVDGLNTSDIINAVTIGGAHALKRDNIGRLAVEAPTWISSWLI
jgi:cytosine/adenosine deaminase-related metal-dependent hydrolase